MPPRQLKSEAFREFTITVAEVGDSFVALGRDAKGLEVARVAGSTASEAENDLKQDLLRRYWRIKPENRKARPVLAYGIAEGVIRAVYRIDAWETYDMAIEAKRWDRAGRSYRRHPPRVANHHRRRPKNLEPCGLRSSRLPSLLGQHLQSRNIHGWLFDHPPEGRRADLAGDDG